MGFISIHQSLVAYKYNVQTNFQELQNAYFKCLFNSSM